MQKTLIKANGNNSPKSRLSVTTLNLDVFYVVTSSYTTFNSISQKSAEKRPEKLNLSKGNNSQISSSSVTILKLDMYYVLTNSFTKCGVNISKDDRVKSRKTKFYQRTITPKK